MFLTISLNIIEKKTVKNLKIDEKGNILKRKFIKNKNITQNNFLLF